MATIFYSKRLQKVLIPFIRKGKANIYIADCGSCGIYNLFRPKVVISEGMIQTFSDEEMDAIIFHEEYHQKI